MVLILPGLLPGRVTLASALLLSESPLLFHKAGK